MNNNTVINAERLPPLPQWSLAPKTALTSYCSDFWLSLILPVVVYWSMSIIFHTFDTWDLFPQYRLHPPAEVAKRNLAGRYHVARDVILQQIIQVVTGAFLQWNDPPEYIGKADYEVAVWATRVRMAQRSLPSILGAFGLNAAALSKRLSASSHPLLAGFTAGGYYPHLTAGSDVPVFATWELGAAQLVYFLLVPCFQFAVAIFILDSWQYFLHRLAHNNSWMYTNFHSRHHRLYVPYAYGALYNHPLEGFVLDTVGAGLAFKVTGMSTLQGIFFFTASTMKTVDDHCGYALPWDPLQLITSNNAAYHDIHHQNWGIKTNYSQPFFTFWDEILNTKYRGTRTNQPKGVEAKSQ